MATVYSTAATLSRASCISGFFEKPNIKTTYGQKAAVGMIMLAATHLWLPKNIRIPQEVKTQSKPGKVGSIGERKSNGVSARGFFDAKHKKVGASDTKLAPTWHVWRF